MSATPTATAASSPTAIVFLPNLESPYHYTPTKSVCIIFVVLFSVSTLCHLFQTIKYRIWWLLPTVILCGIGEILGWSGRLWSSQNILASDPFTMQIACTIIAPTPFLAAIFITFGHLVRRLGERYSLLTSRQYAKVFLTSDLICLVIQAAGGGIAASASTVASENLGGYIMLAGIIAQMISLLIFTVIAIRFFLNFFKDRPVRKMAPSDASVITLTGDRVWNNKYKMLSFALSFITGVLMIRAVYRTIELADGWNGKVISTQVLFNIFDGAMVVLAMYAFSFFHPGHLLFSQPVTSSGVGLGEKNNGARSTVESLA